jgi:hypothetical protein
MECSTCCGLLTWQLLWTFICSRHQLNGCCVVKPNPPRLPGRGRGCSGPVVGFFLKAVSPPGGGKRDDFLGFSISPALPWPTFTLISPQTTDVKTEKKNWRNKRWHWCHWIGLDSLFQKTPTITPTKRTVQPGDAFEDTAFEPRFEIVKF